MLQVEGSKKRPFVDAGYRAAKSQLAFAVSLEMGYRYKAEAPESFVQVAALKRLTQVITFDLTMKLSASLSTSHIKGGARETICRQVKRSIDLKLLQTSKAGIYQGLSRFKRVSHVDAIKSIAVLCPRAAVYSNQGNYPSRDATFVDPVGNAGRLLIFQKCPDIARARQVVELETNSSFPGSVSTATSSD